MPLPIHQIEPDLIAALTAGNRLVLTAPTGSGKTTQAPQILFRSVVKQGQIIILQPRRLATRLVARRVAQEMNAAIGQLVGYQTRHENFTSPATRLRFMTEGLFLRLMQSDPKLPGVAAVMLDEFHERSISADLALGLVRRLQESHRPDLKLVVMSATLDAKAVGEYLACPALVAEGRTFPVDIEYLPRRSDAWCWDLAAEAIGQVIRRQPEGDVLVFMPGMHEINRTIGAARSQVDADVQLLPLHGELPPAAQDQAVAENGRRKVIVATNVAETSITLPGIRAVIDSGLARVNHFDSRRGLNVLDIEPVSRASADQRAGRAGRVAAGLCIRLWPESEHKHRAAHNEPEIRRLELTEALLQIKSLGVRDVAGFPWLSPPDPAALQLAESLLKRLEATDAGGALTAMGRRMSRFPVHPRLARMLIEASQRQCLPRAALWAALIAEREVLIGNDPRKLAGFLKADDWLSDLLIRQRAFEQARAADFDLRRCESIGVHAAASREVDRVSRQLLDVARRLDLSTEDSAPDTELVRCLLVGFPDHLARQLDADRAHCAMPGRKRVVLDKSSIVQGEGLLLALEVSEIGRGDSVQTVLSLATRIDHAWLDPRKIVTGKRLEWNAQIRQVEEIEERSYEGVVLDQTARPPVNRSGAAALLADRIADGVEKLEGWNEAVEQWICRVRLVARYFPQRGLIEYTDEDRRMIIHQIVGDCFRLSQVADKPCIDSVRQALSWEDQQFVEKMAPATIQLPGGYPMKIEYRPDGPPRGQAKIQAFYGATQTPCVAGGKQKIVLEILGPNYRPVQVTDDLASFWLNTYPELKKELKRRYPKHEWR